MRSEGTRGRLLALSLGLALATGCTTTVIDLAAGDGGTDAVTASTPDADAQPSSMDVVPDADAPGSDADSGVSFDEAYDAGTVGGTAHYVTFICCESITLTNCSDERLGGPDTCDDAGGWKKQATDQCLAEGRSFKDYALYGACSGKSTP